MKDLIPESLRRRVRIFRSFFASLFYRLPSRKLKLIAVTGTSGKSTTANMIFHILKENGIRAGVISTNGVIALDKSLDTGLHVTTPDPEDLQKYLRFMVKRKVEWVVVETSSHALAQGRLGFLKFDYAVVTNIKHDHLDWHGNWENYALAKLSLGSKLKKDGRLIINRDDTAMYNFASDHLRSQNIGDKILVFSNSELQNSAETKQGIIFELAGTTYSLPILGEYNIENALATFTLAKNLGMKDDKIKSAFSSFHGIKGRMQIMKKEPFLVIVNFAHNADSLERSLKSARKLVEPGGKLICIFGSAGQRDIEKRYAMGEVSGKFADVTIITAEDPRTESLTNINDQILEGVKRNKVSLSARFKTHKEYKTHSNKIEKTERNTVYVFDEESVQNRYDAIEFGIKSAFPGDVIITEGKGHEESLCFGVTEYPFTDQDAVKTALKSLNKQDSKSLG